MRYDEGDQEHGVSELLVHDDTTEAVQRKNRGARTGERDPYSMETVRRRLQQEAERERPRHAVLEGAVPGAVLRQAFEGVLREFTPHLVSTINYPEWKISSYAEYTEKKNPMPGTSPGLLRALAPLLEVADSVLTREYCRLHGKDPRSIRATRLQTFVTRYRPNPTDSGLPLHVDGIGVDGSIVMGLPTAAPFEGGGLSVWDRARRKADCLPGEGCRHYEMKPGDVCFLDRLVWHQAEPIVSGERYALVVFYRVRQGDAPQGPLADEA